MDENILNIDYLWDSENNLKIWFYFGDQNDDEFSFNGAQYFFITKHLNVFCMLNSNNMDEILNYLESMNFPIDRITK